MKKTTQQIKKAYQEILEVCEKHSGLSETNGFDFGDIKDTLLNAKNHLMIVEWSEKYGIELRHDTNPYSSKYLKINENLFFSQYGDAKKEKESRSGRFISWSDDGSQPLNEWLLGISFSTGVYIFGDDYPTGLFEKFFNELKGYKPDFLDSANKALYWKIDNSKDIYKDFSKILKKYHDLNKADYKKRQIKKMEKELNELKEAK